MSGTLRGTVHTTSVPEGADYDPEVGEDIESDPDHNTQPPAPEPDDEAAAEVRARRMGWTPFADYRGDPAKWRPASEWLDRAEQMLPISQQMNHSLERKLIQNERVINDLKRSLDEQKLVLEDMRRLGLKADQRGYDRAMAELAAKKADARSSGDFEEFEKLVDQEQALVEAHKESTANPAPPPPPPEPASPQLSQPTQDFLAQNTWFRTDPFLARKMTDRHLDVLQEGIVVDEAEQYVEAKRRLMEDYPDRFPGTRPAPPREPAPPPVRPRPSTALRPTPPTPPRRDQGLTINSIADPEERKEARGAFDRMKRQMPNYTEDEYMRLYGNPHTDVLELQQAKRQK